MRLVVFTALALVAIGCSSNTREVVPRSFDRPGEVTFACFDDGSKLPVPLDNCTFPEADEQHSLHALVTQTSRGEVAAVDLKVNRVLDSDRRIPGYTFVRVGEIPSAIVVPRADPRYTYVAANGSQEIYAVPTARFRPDAPATAETEQRIALEAAPSALVLSPAEDALFAALPEAGVIVRLPIGPDGRLGDPERVELDTAIPDPVAIAEPPAEYCKSCPSGCSALMQVPAGYEPRDPIAMGDEPAPIAFAIDPIAGRLLVADAALPVVHVIDLATGSEIEPIVTSVPTTALALTPEVPDLVYDATAMVRYLYAIDATDGSVIAIDYPSGAVLPVDAQDYLRANDRIGFPAPARAIEIATPRFPEGDVCELGVGLAGTAGPLQLRGVFLTVALTDGSVRIVDVYDLDANCRGGDRECSGGNLEDAVAHVRRHHPRIGAFVRGPVGLTGVPTLIANGVTFRLTNDGTTSDALAPDMLPLEGCPQSMVQAFPDPQDGPPVVCTRGDPWSAIEEQWTVEFEGSILGATGGRGRFELSPDGPAFAGEIPFCGRGVLGADDVPDAGVESGNQGDLLVITSDLPTSTKDDSGCARFVNTESVLRDPIDFPILRAFDGRLVIGRSTRGGSTIEEVAYCFPELVEYEIHVQGAYAVTGGRSGFLHRVLAGTNGRCSIDPAAPVRYARARVGVPFDNGLVAFEIAPPSDDTVASMRGDTVQVLFTVGEIPPKLGLDVGTLPGAIRYSDITEDVFVVDSSSRGLVQVALTTFSLLRTFE